MKNKVSVLITVVIIIMAIAIIGGTICYFSSQNQKSQSKPDTLLVSLGGKYEFVCPPEWQVSANQYNEINTLFGPEANSASGLGGVEVFDASGQSVNDFLNGVAAHFTNKEDIIIDGVSGAYVSYSASTIKGVSAVLLKDGKIYNIYLNSEKEEDIALFRQILSSFEFLTPDSSIKVVLPNGGEVWSKGEKITIFWNATKTIKSVNIILSIAGSEEGQSFNAAIAINIPNTGKYEWTVQELYSEVWGVNALPASDKYLITIEDSEHNNIYDAGNTFFSIK